MTYRGESRPRAPGRFVSARGQGTGDAAGDAPPAPEGAVRTPPRPVPRPAKTAKALAARKATNLRRQGLLPGEVAALVVSLAWLGLVGWVFLTRDDARAAPTANAPLGAFTTILGVLLPVALIWVAAYAARIARRIRDESARLRAEIEALRQDQVDRHRAGADALRDALEAGLAEVTRAQAVLAAEVAAIRAQADREPPLSLPPRPDAPDAPRAVGPEPGVEPLPPEDFIRALDLPRDARDAEGFRVLRAALENPKASPLVIAAQDLLTLLAQDGIYMDDLTVHPADPVLWRAYADGTRGPDVAALAGIRDRSSLALAGGRMKDDAVFRDAVHHFLQTFARAIAGFAADATDAEIARFADTRTARAFMLAARIAGIFD